MIESGSLEVVSKEISSYSEKKIPEENYKYMKWTPGKCYAPRYWTIRGFMEAPE